MRRGGILLVVLGTLLLWLAPLSRFYVADRVVKAPLDFYQKIEYADTKASFYDYLLKPAAGLHKGVTIRALTTISGDVRAGDDDTAVWRANTSVWEEHGGATLSLSQYNYAFDRTSSVLVPSKWSGVSGDENVKPAGFGMIWPIADVQRETYNFFDPQTKRTWPMRFSGTERIQGVLTYRFVQKIEPTLVAKVKDPVDAKMVGLPKKAKPVSVNRYLGADVTVWVDPRTGLPIKQQDHLKSTVRTRSGDEGTIFDANLVTVDRDQKALAKVSSDYADQISTIRETVPGVSLVLGFALLAVGGVLTLFFGGPQAPRSAGRPGRPPEGTSGMEPVPVELSGVQVRN
jgi:hypothetical protein